jgi:hypothetical protein
MIITVAKLKNIISSGEALKIDFKEIFELKNESQKKEFAKDVSAIANTPGERGFLIYGVTNNRKVVGISPSVFKEEQMQQIISSRCDPPIIFLAHKLKYLGHQVGILEIPHSTSRPHQYLPEGNFFIRRGTTTDKMSVLEVSSAIVTRTRIERYTRGAYDSLSSGYRAQQIKKDFIDVYKEFGYTYSGYTEFSTYRRTLTADKVQNSEERTRFHITAYNDTITYYDLQLYDFLLNKVSDGFRVRKNARPWLNVFLIVSYEPITMNTIKKHNQSMFHTSVKLDGSTIYNGLGDFNHQDMSKLKDIRNMNHVIQPEFFVTRVRSTEDIRTRIGMISDFIQEKTDVFGIIQKLQSKTPVSV